MPPRKHKTKAASEGIAPTVIIEEELNSNGDSNGDRDKNGRLKKGVVLNPAGRPKGSRNKLEESFLSAMVSAFEEGGAEAIRKVRDEEPAVFLNVIAKIIPKHVEKTVNVKVEDLTDDELVRIAAGSSFRASETPEHSARLN